MIRLINNHFEGGSGGIKSEGVPVIGAGNTFNNLSGYAANVEGAPSFWQGNKVTNSAGGMNFRDSNSVLDKNSFQNIRHVGVDARGDSRLFLNQNEFSRDDSVRYNDGSYADVRVHEGAAVRLLHTYASRIRNSAFDEWSFKRSEAELIHHLVVSASSVTQKARFVYMLISRFTNIAGKISTTYKIIGLLQYLLSEY